MTDVVNELQGLDGNSDEREGRNETGMVAADAELMDEIRRGLADLEAGRAKLYSLDDLFRTQVAVRGARADGRGGVQSP